MISFQINWMSDSDVTLVVTKSVKSWKGDKKRDSSSTAAYSVSFKHCS